MLTRRASTHGHLHLSLIYRRLEPTHVLWRHGLRRSICHRLLTRLHLWRLLILLLRSEVFARHSENEAIRAAVPVLANILQLRLRSYRRLLVISIGLVSLHRY